MAINYTEVGWDTSKYVNPTNMNQMDNGIKAACDGVDDLDSTKLDKTGGNITGTLTIGGYTAMTAKGVSTFTPTGAGASGYYAERCYYNKTNDKITVWFNITVSGAGTEIIKASDLGITSFNRAAFAVAWGFLGSTGYAVRLATSATGIVVDQIGNSFPTGGAIYGQMEIPLT